MALRSDRRLKQADKVFLGRRSLSLPLSLCSQHSGSQKQLQPVGVCVVGGCSSGLGLEHIFVCLCMRTFPCAVSKGLVLNVCLRVNLQPSVFVQGLFLSN